MLAEFLSYIKKNRVFCLLRKIFFPDPIKDYVEGNVLILGVKGAGAVTVSELIKSTNEKYSALEKISIVPSYSTSVDAMKRSFGLPVGKTRFIKTTLINDLRATQATPSVRGVTLALDGKSERLVYDKLVNKVLDVIPLTNRVAKVLISISEVELLKPSTAMRICELAKDENVVFVLTAYSLRVRSEELMSSLDSLVVTRVQGARLLFSKFHQRFPIDGADPIALTEGGRGEYHLFTASGRIFSQKIKT
ncbi:hypothetical protein [Vibrio sp. D431a]|uniref:hypothetical protein n=1 Tax=Vibrio sp. D431a TaxID=2837388 RepID=UPI002556010B|nr:hypothetical protein [Vibrio sp. D431a]MDK9790094.1 hypothetical protein [Vibrio sp. D431a]